MVLETGNPVAMPWLERSAAVLQAWYPGPDGARGRRRRAVRPGQSFRPPSDELPTVGQAAAAPYLAPVWRRAASTTSTSRRVPGPASAGSPRPAPSCCSPSAMAWSYTRFAWSGLQLIGGKSLTVNPGGAAKMAAQTLKP